MSACTCYEAGRDPLCPEHGQTAGIVRLSTTWPVPMACLVCGGKGCAYCKGSGPR